ncbi:ABC-three component system middle component 4, partial [Klebsiella pneumoniae]
VLRNDGVTLIKLSENGKLFFNNLDSDFFNQVKQHVKSISALKSCTTPKLNKLINDLVRISE